jgi:hypothetical protein
MDPETRDRIKSPSINFPRTEAEAQRAILLAVRNRLFSEHSADGSPIKTRTNEAGFGTERRDEQTKWLNDASDLIGAIIMDKLDEIEAVL